MEFNFFEGSTDFINNLRKGNALLITKSDNKVNAMQIGWGYMGYMWKKPSIVVAVRHSRYSYDLIRSSEAFVVSMPVNDELKEAVKICGLNSGRDVNKIEKCGFVTEKGKIVDVPYIKGCLNYECRIMYKQAIDSELIDEELHNVNYKNNDYHVMFYGEIVAVHNN